MFADCFVAFANFFGFAAFHIGDGVSDLVGCWVRIPAEILRESYATLVLLPEVVVGTSAVVLGYFLEFFVDRGIGTDSIGVSS